jgi:tRNA A-37 threonylcarbamoyl transferase component Bud32
VSLEIVASPASKVAPLGMRLLPASRGWIEYHPRFREMLAARGLLTAESVLALSGEIVSGHPDRHVLRVEWPAFSGFLKRQHRLGRFERLKHRLAGFGWSSRSFREARLLRELEREGLPCPQWVAVGEDGDGRAFLLVEELQRCVELRRLLRDTAMSQSDRVRLAEKSGQAIAELHAAGFDTPDLTVKHVFVNPDTFAMTLVDWQSARRRSVSRDAKSSERSAAPATGPRQSEALAALDASIADALADTGLRLRFLWSYRRVIRRSGILIPRFSKMARAVDTLSQRARRRRSIRDQRQTSVTQAEQRLVWVVGEAVCAIPEIAAIWPKPAIASPFYGSGPSVQPIRIQLSDGRPAELLRGRSLASQSRLIARLRGKPWRSPGVTFGRILFHLQRYGIPAPQLYAFGQHDREWFVLYEPPVGRPLEQWLADSSDPVLKPEVLDQAEHLSRQLSDSGCRVLGSPFFVSEEGRVTVGDIRILHL